MSETLVHARVEAIRRLSRRRAGKALEKAIAKSSAEDVVEALAHLARAERHFLVEHVDASEQAGEVLLLLGSDDFTDLVQSVPQARLVEWLHALEPDDEADVLARFPEALRAQLLERLDRSDREEVEELLAWPSDSAGGIMSPVAFRVHEDTSCREAIEALQDQQADVEMIFYLYIENDAGKCVGVTSLRNLLINPPSTPLRDIMASDVMSVSPSTDQEEVARLASRYDLLAVPVVDEDGKMLGIVTIDDVIDVIREEAAEDLMIAAGMSELDPHASSVIGSMRHRSRWLFLTLLAGMGLAEIINVFEASLQRNAIMAGFIPVVMGMGGNVGIQAATITVRNLATGHVSYKTGVWGIVSREVRVGLLMGLVFGLVLFLYALARHPDPLVGAAVGTSILLASTVAAVLGTLSPLIFDRLDIDPAVATGPFVTTVIDVVAITFYFLVVTRVFGL